MRPRYLTDAPFGINIIGYVTGSFGLGIATRNTITLLKKRDIPLALADVDPGGDRQGHDTTFQPLAHDHADPTPHPLNLFHMNPPQLAEQLWMNPSWSRKDRVSACVPFWELPQLPEAWLPVLSAMDIVLAPTRFVEDAVNTALPEAMCVYYQQAAFVPDDVEPDRARWGVPSEALAFVSSFDASSDISRKNPEATVRAFLTAFPARPDVCLVLKINSGSDARELFARQLSDLEKLAATDHRIVLIHETLAYRDVLCLYASCDVLVSLHRSEGLGLSLMEAMSFGKPVIATGWSGNMDFMTDENSCAVDYEFIPVVSEHPSYHSSIVGHDVFWANPSEDDAARHMVRLAEDPALREAMGERARQDMADLRATYERGEIIEILRSAIAPQSPLWTRHATKRRALRRIARGSHYRNVRRLGGKVLRALGLRKPAR